jgi:Ni/Co efflux regulator RcnB
MNSRIILAIAAFAAVASTGARADEADASQYAIESQGSRTRAEVMAEAAGVARTRSVEPAGSRVAAPARSSLDASTVRAEAAQALRLGQIPRGEAGTI